MRKVPLIADCYYHIYNRGVDKGPIFFLPQNWLYFLGKLRKYFTPDKGEIIAYCLMPNHYHLLVRINGDDAAHRVMQPLSVSYTKAINKQQDRVGPLFQGPFQARVIAENQYLLHLSRYIHRNPVEAGLVEYSEEWEYSSYRDYIGTRKGTLPQKGIILDQFSSEDAYQNLSGHRLSQIPACQMIFCWIKNRVFSKKSVFQIANNIKVIIDSH